MFAGKTCLTVCGVENCAVRFVILSESESSLLPSTVHVRGICLGKLVLDKTTENQK